MKKIIVLLFLVAGMMTQVKAEDIIAVDLHQPLVNARIGIAWNAKGDKLGVAYIPVMYIVGSSSGREYVTLNLGASDELATGKTGYLVSVGARIDSVFTKLGDTSFAKKYLRFAILPPLQISPTLLTADFKKYDWYLTVATKFGGK